MGFKALLLLVIVIFIAVFSLQNIQAISLVFFSFNSITLPLSFWIVLSLFAGIFSSFLIQFLSGNKRQASNYKSSYPNSRSNSPYSPPPVNPPNIPSQREEIPQYNDNSRANNFNQEAINDRERSLRDPNRFDYVSQVQNPVNAEEEFIEEDWIDEPLEDNINDLEKEHDRDQVKQNTVAENNNQIDLEETDDLSEEVNQPEKTPVESSPINEPPAPSLLKSRQASLYSYQPKEKTKIETKPQPEPQTEPQNTEEEPDSNRAIPINLPPRRKKVNNSSSSRRQNRSRRTNSSGVYDASYRVITPSRNDRNRPDPRYDDRNYQPDDDFDWDEDEDWDF